MFIPHEGPGTWQSFLKRKDNIGLTIMESRQKYLKEQLLFENYVSTLQTLNTVSTAAAGAAGGPAPSTGGGGGGGGDYLVEFKVNTNYNITSGYFSVPNPTTRLNLNFSTTEINNYFAGNPFDNGNVWNGDVTIDWGDGTVETKTGYDVGGTDTSNIEANWWGKIGLVQHDYTTDGEYTVKIKGPGAYYLRFMWTPLVELIKYDPSLTEDFSCLFAYMPRTATQNFTTDISNWVIPSGKSLSCIGSNFAKEWNIGSAFRRDYGFEIDISNWDISGTTSLKRAFTRSDGFNSSQIANWAVPSTCDDLENAFNMIGDALIQGSTCNTLDVSSWDTSGVKNFQYAWSKSDWGGTGANSLTFNSIDQHPVASTLGVQNAFELKTGGVGTLPAVPSWNFGGDATSTGIWFPGAGAVGPGSYANWFNTYLPINKTDFGTTLVGWANNAGLTTNSRFDASYASTPDSNDFDYSGDATVQAALTTLQNTKGWTLVGFTF